MRTPTVLVSLFLALTVSPAFGDSIPVPTTYFSQDGVGIGVGFGASSLPPIIPLPHFWQVPWLAGQINLDYSNSGNGYINLDIHNVFLFGNLSDVSSIKLGGSSYLEGLFTGEEFIPESGNHLALYDVSGNFYLYSGGITGTPGYIRVTSATYSGQTLTTPEPEMMVMMGTGLLMVAGMAWRKFRAA
jgi:hypothetical protein